MASEAVEHDDEEELEDYHEELVDYLETILENQQKLNDYLRENYKHRSAWSYVFSEFGVLMAIVVMAGLFFLAMAISN